MVASYQSTLRYYEKFAPMQEKMFRMMEREIDEMDEAEKWKTPEDENENEDENEEGDNFGDADDWKITS